jgi:transposase InsO family protein
MSERFAFIKACLDRKRSIAETCVEFGISEKTGYKQLKRFKEGGVEALRDRSHAPLAHPHRITPEVKEQIIALRRRYPLYGAQTLHDILVQSEPGKHWPAASSIGDLLKRENLISLKNRRDRSSERRDLDTGRTRALEPNMVWTADFKGEFRLNAGAGPYCYALTVLDLHSRYLLACRGLENVQVGPTEKIFIKLFRENGLPTVIRTDNGLPFAQSNAIGGLGRLGFLFARLGIRPEHIKPATPSENGAHERFHRTLKAAATKPSSASFQAQQRRFDEFQTEYNTHRPHSSLPNHRPPAEFYTHSPRPYPEKLPMLVYPDDAQVRWVMWGFIKWRNHKLFISKNAGEQYVGLTEIRTENDRPAFAISYGQLELGYVDPDTFRFTPRVRWRG